jgi:hypothetical protein
VPATPDDDTAGGPAGPAVPGNCRTAASSAEDATAGQLRSAVPGPGAVPAEPDTLSRVNTAGVPGFLAGSVYCRLIEISRSG